MPTKKHFDAILAKNDIARELRSSLQNGTFSASLVKQCLLDIEEYIGESNQPSVKDIMENEHL